MASENSYSGYWKVYGGVNSLLRSSYFWISIVITIICKGIWLKPQDKIPSWADLAITVAPSILGFSLGGMAIMLSFSSGRFLNAVRQDGKTDSYFMKMMASFFHFTLVLSLSIILSILIRLQTPELVNYSISFIGFFTLIYGILLIPATVGSVWHTARIFNAATED